MPTRPICHGAQASAVPCEGIEHAIIIRTIEEAGGDRRVAAERLDIGLSSLYRKLEEYDRVVQGAGPGGPAEPKQRSGTA